MQKYYPNLSGLKYSQYIIIPYSNRRSFSPIHNRYCISYLILLHLNSISSVSLNILFSNKFWLKLKGRQNSAVSHNKNILFGPPPPKPLRYWPGTLIEFRFISPTGVLPGNLHVPTQTSCYRRDKSQQKAQREEITSKKTTLKDAQRQTLTGALPKRVPAHQHCNDFPQALASRNENTRRVLSFESLSRTCLSLFIQTQFNPVYPTQLKCVRCFTINFPMKGIEYRATKHILVTQIHTL
jgi:hypothetical protein